MTRMAWVFVAALSGAALLGAGPAAVAETAPLTIVTKSFTSAQEPGFRHGGVYLFVTNNSRSAVEALVFSVDWRFKRGLRAHTVRYIDHAANPGDLFDRQIMPGDTRRFEFGENPKITFHAAIFADGSSYGDPAWVERIAETRKLAYESLKAAARQLQIDAGSGMTYSEIAADLESRGHSAASGRADDPLWDLRTFRARGYFFAARVMSARPMRKGERGQDPARWTHEQTKRALLLLGRQEFELSQAMRHAGEPPPR